EADPAVERFLRGGAAPVRFVTRTAPTASLSLLSALRRGEIVAMQGDRALGTRGDVLQPFFGAPAPFPLGPFVLARAAGAPVARGVAAPLGLDLASFWSALCTGVDGISAIERFRVDDLRVGRGGEIKKLRALRHGRLPRCRASALLLLAADDLLTRAALAADPARVAVVVGTALGGVEEGERALGERGARAA